MNIIINGKIKKVEEITKEKELQGYLEENRSALQIDEDMKIVSRELGLITGRTDAIGISDDYIYIIETKLRKNRDRRNVIAQILDYGTAIEKIGSDEFFDKLKKKSFDEKIRKFIDSKKKLIIDNQDGGKFIFVILMDKVSKDLKQIISFINSYSKFSIYVIEFNKFSNDGDIIYVPLIHGGESMKKVSISNRLKWNLEKFNKEINKLSKEYRGSIVKILTFGHSSSDDHKYGTGSQTGSVRFIYSKINKTSLFTIRTNGEIEIQDGVPDEVKYIFRNKFKEWSGKNIYDKSYFSISIEDWKDHIDDFKSVINLIIKKK